MSFFKIDRSLLDHALWLEGPFAPGQAWIDLVGLAAYRRHSSKTSGTIERGQLHVSQVWLSRRWRWTRKRTRRFLNRLQAANMIEVVAVRGRETGHTKVTLINYGKFQDVSATCPASVPFGDPLSAIGGNGAGDPFNDSLSAHLRPITEEGKKGRNTPPTPQGGRTVAPETVVIPPELQKHEAAIREWFRYRGGLGKPVKTASLKAAFLKMLALGDALPESLRESAASGWQGFFPPKANGGGQKEPETLNEAAARIGRELRAKRSAEGAPHA